ncbi:hypothetical protein RZS08_39625, partial [Arthrospira platensis SPKY1]|nr:hypothetical protein [Arthrospira platensis SPKY1]
PQHRLGVGRGQPLVQGQAHLPLRAVQAQPGRRQAAGQDRLHRVRRRVQQGVQRLGYLGVAKGVAGGVEQIFQVVQQQDDRVGVGMDGGLAEGVPHRPQLCGRAAVRFFIDLLKLLPAERRPAL